MFSFKGVLPVFFDISLRESFMSFLKSSIVIMRLNFKSESYFSSVLGYAGLSVVWELDFARWPWFLLLMSLFYFLYSLLTLQIISPFRIPNFQNVP